MIHCLAPYDGSAAYWTGYQLKPPFLRMCSQCGSLHPEDVILLGETEVTFKSRWYSNADDPRHSALQGSLRGFDIRIPTPEILLVGYKPEGRESADEEDRRLNYPVGRFMISHLMDEGWDDEAWTAVTSVLLEKTSYSFSVRPIPKLVWEVPSAREPVPPSRAWEPPQKVRLPTASKRVQVSPKQTRLFG